ncbi:MAG: hypothetical protein R3282_08905, partial [Rhodothermales bacterium]|nr:hypothetical protein [Rhodothermales bacterium]
MVPQHWKSIIRVFFRIPLAVIALSAVLSACDSDSATVDLAAPALQGPVDGSTFQARSFVEFSWSAVEGATLYEVSFEYADFPEHNEVVTTLVPLTVYELAEIGEV